MTQEQLKALYEAEQKKEQEASARYQKTYSLADNLAWERAIGRTEMARELWYATLAPTTWQPWMAEVS